MKSVAAFLIAVFPLIVTGAEIMDAIPDDAVVVIAGQHPNALQELRRILDECVPATVSASAAGARMPLLGQLSDLRGILDKQQIEEGGSINDAGAVIVLAGADGGAQVLFLESVEEAAWRDANRSRVKSGGSAEEVSKDGRRSYFTFNSGFLVTARSPEAIGAYQRVKAGKLSAARRERLGALLGAHLAAANVSAPALVRAWSSKTNTAANAVAAGLCEILDGYSTGLDTIPFPEKLIAAITGDFLSHGGEIYLAADVTPDGTEITGSVELKQGGFYRSMFAAQKGGAEEALDLVPSCAVAALAVSFDGDVFRSYARGLVASYVGGVLSDQAALPASLKLAQQIFEEFKDKIGFRRTVFMSLAAEDGKYAGAAIAAKVPDANAAASLLSKSLAQLYGDVMLQSHARQLGFFLNSPETVAGKGGVIAVNVPFGVSAMPPARARRIKDIMGTQIVWRVVPVDRAGTPAVIAGEGIADKTAEGLAGEAGGMFPGGTHGAGTVMAGFLNLPQMVASRMKVYTKLAGGSMPLYNAPDTRPGCSLGLGVAGDGLALRCSVPNQQIKAAYAVLRGNAKTTVIKPAAAKEGSDVRSGKPDGPKGLNRPKPHRVMDP